MGIYLSQCRYISDLLRKSNMLEAKPVFTPMSSTTSLSQFYGDSFKSYPSVVGYLQYLAITCPDMAFVVGKVCQFMHRPTVNNWIAVKHIL